MRLRGVLLSFNIVKKIDSKYCAIAKFFNIETQKLHQLYFLKDHCNDVEKLLKLKNEKVEIEIELPYNLIVKSLNKINK